MNYPMDRNDILELKNKLFKMCELKNHKQIAEYNLKLAKHILEITNMKYDDIIRECIDASIKWQNDELKFQDARSVAFKANMFAREQTDIIKEKIYKFMGQVVATSSVRYHALEASETAITIINLLYPNNLDEVRKERDYQIELMNSIK